MGRKQDFWKQHIAAWQASSQTQAGYCREHQLSLASFGYWRRRLKVKARSAAKGMIPIVPPAVADGMSLEIALRNGLTLRVPVTAEPARIAAWVQVLVTC